MQNKLFKYDFKWTYKIIVFFHIASLFFAVTTRIFSLFKNSNLFSILTSISTGVLIAMLVNSLVNGLIRSWLRFINNHYKDESYLTHTLPVSKNDLLKSKIFSGLAIILSNIVVAVVSIFIAFYSKENLDKLLDSLNLISTQLNFNIGFFLFLIVLLIALQLFFFIMIGYLGIMIGYGSNDNKLVKSIISGFVLYIAASVLTLLVVLVLSLFIPSISEMLNTTNQLNVGTLQLLLVIISLLYCIYSVICYYVGNKLFNKGVNIE